MIIHDTLGSPLKSIPTNSPFAFALYCKASCTVSRASSGPSLRLMAIINLPQGGNKIFLFWCVTMMMQLFLYIYDKPIYQHRNDSLGEKTLTNVVVITVERMQNVTLKHDKFFCVKEQLSSLHFPTMLCQVTNLQCKRLSAQIT